MPDTVLEAIKLGFRDFEPKDAEHEEFAACQAMPGTPAKLSALAERVRLGLPLWHPDDRHDCDDESDWNSLADDERLPPDEHLLPATAENGARIDSQAACGRLP